MYANKAAAPHTTTPASAAMTFHGMRSTMNGTMSSSQENTMRGWANTHSPPTAMKPRIHGHTRACGAAGRIVLSSSSSVVSPDLRRCQLPVKASHNRNVTYSQYGSSVVASP